MTRQFLIAGLVVLLGSAGASIAANGATVSVGAGEPLKHARIRPDGDRTITLKAEGQIDPASLAVTFTGQATHLGRFTATGEYVVDQQKFQGEITVNPGDILAYDVWIYADGDVHGTWPCTIDLRGITGDFTRATAQGTCTVNDDDSFTFDVAGSIEPPPPTCPAEPCPGTHAIAIDGEGQIDFGTSSVAFAGRASHLGQFTAVGDLAGEQVRGAITLSPDDYFDYVISFQVASDIHGTHPCSINMSGSGERYRYTRSTAEGTCAVDDAGSFTFSFDGSIWEVEPPPPCLSEPCLLSD